MTFCAVFAAATALLLCSCDRRHVPDREEYVEFWTIACLRSREKGTEPAEELTGMLANMGITSETFDYAEELHFSEETLTAVRRGIRRLLESPGFVSRPEYIRMRVAAYLRSRIRGTSFVFEVGCVCERKGCRRADFHASERIWAGDAETERDIRTAFEERSEALGVPWHAWVEINGSDRYSSGSRDDWLLEQLESRGISAAGWQAFEDLFMVSRAEFARFKVIAELRSELLGNPFDSELALIAGRQGFNARYFTKTALVEDDETALEEQKHRARLSGALRVPLDAYRALLDIEAAAKPEKTREALASELKKRGVYAPDFEAMHEVLRW